MTLRWKRRIRRFRHPSTMTMLLPPAGYTPALLIFDDQFSAALLDQTKWNANLGDDKYGRWGKTVPAPYSAEDAGGFNLEYYDPYIAGAPLDPPRFTGKHLITANGLTLMASPSGKFAGYSWAGAAISTYGKAHLPATGGYVQISAKMPDCRYGAWPGLWLMPTAGSDGAEFDLHEGGFYGTTGDAKANRILHSHWFGGTNSQHGLDTGIDLSAGYHIYGVEYWPGRWWKVYLDGSLMFTWTDGISTNAGYEVIIDLAMAGPQTEGWHTVASPQHPGAAWMYANDVQIYRLP